MLYYVMTHLYILKKHFTHDILCVHIHRLFCEEKTQIFCLFHIFISKGLEFSSNQQNDKTIGSTEFAYLCM